MHRQSVFQIVENGIVKQISSSISQLKKEGTNEVLYTTSGERILLENIISLNGMSWV